MLKRGILKVAVAAIFVAAPVGGIAVAGSGTALATTPAASQAVTSQAVIPAAPAPACQPPIILHRFTTYSSCTAQIAQRVCTPGNQGNFSVIPSYAANGCIYRVWLYAGANQTGGALCITPHSATGFLSVARRSFRIVSNQSAC